MLNSMKEQIKCLFDKQTEKDNFKAWHFDACYFQQPFLQLLVFKPLDKAIYGGIVACNLNLARCL